MYRYLVVKDADTVQDTKVIMRSNDKESVEYYIQRNAAKDMRVYELKYTAENVLCSVEYEGESDESDPLSDVALPTADDEVCVCRCATPEKRYNMISHPGSLNRSSTVDA